MSIFSAGKYTFEIGKKTLVMGILNVTPDSFSDGGVYFDTEKAVKRALEMQRLGADIIDIGGQSTRPESCEVTPQEEWSRISPVLQGLCGELSVPISVDTFYPEVAEKSLQLGVSIINDVKGFKDPRMLRLAAESDCGVIIMHSGSVRDMKSFFAEKLSQAESCGISRCRICLDPGIGFLESRVEDRYVINNLREFKIKDVAFLVGISRKRVVSEYCSDEGNYAKLPGTIAANTIAIQNGADIIRVHDVREGVFAAAMADAILKTKEIL